MEDEIVYFELNHWSNRYYPPVEPFESWISYGETGSWIRPVEEMDQWYKDNELVVVTSFIDMSINFCVSAKKSWVEKTCPELLNKTEQKPH